MRPAKAADMPKKKMAILNAHSTSPLERPRYSAMSLFNRDQQYTVPILQWSRRAGIAALTHLLFGKPFIFFSHFLYVILKNPLTLLYIDKYLFQVEKAGFPQSFFSFPGTFSGSGFLQES